MAFLAVSWHCNRYMWNMCHGFLCSRILLSKQSWAMWCRDEHFENVPWMLINLFIVTFFDQMGMNAGFNVLWILYWRFNMKIRAETVLIITHKMSNINSAILTYDIYGHSSLNWWTIRVYLTTFTALNKCWWINDWTKGHKASIVTTYTYFWM